MEVIGAAAAVPRAVSRHPVVAAVRQGRERMSPAEDLQRRVVRALRHGEFGFRGSFERGGYLSIDSLKAAFGGSEDVWSEAFRLDRRARKTRIDYSRPGFLRALQGHSADCGHELSYMAAPLDESAVADLQRSHGKYIYHGTDVHVVEGIVAQGLLPGGGPGGRLANHFVVGNMPRQWSEARGFRRGSNVVVQCDLEVLRKSGAGSFTERTECSWRTPSLRRLSSGSSRLTTSAGPTQRSWPRSVLIVGCTSCTTSGPRPRKQRRTSATAAGSADVAGPAAPAEGAEAEEADTEESSSDSDLPDTTAPVVGKAEDQERSAAEADVDMADAMTEAAEANPSLTVGELVDQTNEKLQYMAGYMDCALSSAGAEHRRVLEHAEKLLRRSEEYLEQRDAEAGAAASGAPSSGSAALDRDARLLDSIDSFMGKAEAKDDPMGDASKEERSSSEELLPDELGRAHLSASRVPRQFKAATHVAPALAIIMAALSDEAPDFPAEEADGTYACPECGKKVDSVVRWHLHRAACHSVPRSKVIFPVPTSSDVYHQDFRGAWFRLSGEGHFFEMTEVHQARSARQLGPDTVLPLLPSWRKGIRFASKTELVSVMERVSTRSPSPKSTCL